MLYANFWRNTNYCGWNAKEIPDSQCIATTRCRAGPYVACFVICYQAHTIHTWYYVLLFRGSRIPKCATGTIGSKFSHKSCSEVQLHNFNPLNAAPAVCSWNPPGFRFLLRLDVSTNFQAKRILVAALFEEEFASSVPLGAGKKEKYVLPTWLHLRHALVSANHVRSLPPVWPREKIATEWWKWTRFYGSVKTFHGRIGHRLASIKTYSSILCEERFQFICILNKTGP